MIVGGFGFKLCSVFGAEQKFFIAVYKYGWSREALS